MSSYILFGLRDKTFKNFVRGMVGGLRDFEKFMVR
jgi:hypothetical protein